MLKLLIVDDEPIILTGLVKTFPWEKWGYQVVGSADNGVHALTLISDLHPDVVITDIRMNHMTGLELIEQSLILFPEITFIVMSAYRDFDYAKEACRLGAYTYLLKPLKEETLKETMLSAHDFCTQQQDYSQLTKNYNSFLEKHASGYVCTLLRSYLQEQLSDLEFQDALTFVNRNWNLLHYICIYTAVDPSTAIYPSHSGSYMLLEYLKKQLKNYFDGYILESPDSKLLLVLTIKAGNIMNRSRLEELFVGFRDKFQIEVIYSVSKEYDKITDIKKAALEAAELLVMADDAGLDQLYPETFIEENRLSNSQLQYPLNHTILVIKAIRSLNVLLTKKALEGFILELAAISDTEYQKLCIQRLTLEIFSTYIDSSLPDSLHNSFQKFIQNFASIQLLKTIPILQQLIYDLINHLEKRSNLDTSNTTISYIEEAKLYAANHISDEHLNVASIADILHLNAVYFGRIFKRGTGIGFKTYLLNLRLEQAKQLLTETSLSIAKITEQTGFPNPSYFSYLFKANVGCLPNEFRKGSIS